MLSTHLVTARADLAALEVPWNILAAGYPMRSWNWLATWWQYYGNAPGCELHVLAVYEDAGAGPGTLVGIAPWYIERGGMQGNVIRPLGSGHVCTDHLSLIARPDYLASVADAVATYLMVNDDDWDQLAFSSIDEDDDAAAQLIAELEARDGLVAGERAGNCWIIKLPETWDAYLASLSSSHRRQLRKTYRGQIESGRTKLHLVTTPAELDEAWNVLVELHQRRRNGLGDEGCFASRQFHDFHRAVTESLLRTQQLRMSWTELDGKPFTAEYHFSSPETVYTYQSGMDTARLDESPGRLAYLLTVKRAISDGYTQLDFLRGDEPYKAHFRAEAHRTFDYQVFPDRRLAKLRGHVLLAADTIKGWVKQSMAAVKG